MSATVVAVVGAAVLALGLAGDGASSSPVGPVVLGATASRASSTPVLDALTAALGPSSTTEPPTTEPASVPPPPPAPAPAVAVSPATAAKELVRARFDWERWLPGWRVEMVGPRRGYQGSTFPAQRLVEVYVRPSMSTAQVAHVLAHELGHAVDVTYFDDATRAAVRAARGLSPGVTWFVDSGASDFASGAGDWAETFSWWATDGLGRWASELGPPPTDDDMAWIEDVVATAVGAA